MLNRGCVQRICGQRSTFVLALCVHTPHSVRTTGTYKMCVDPAIYVGCLGPQVRYLATSAVSAPDTDFPAVFSIMFETILFSLTMWVAISRVSTGEGISALCMTLFRDGTLHFVAVACE